MCSPRMCSPWMCSPWMCSPPPPPRPRRRRRHRFVRRDCNCNGEAIFQSAQMRALLIEHIKRDVGTGTSDQIMRGAPDQLLLERTQHLQSERGDRTDMTAAAAIGAFLGRTFEHAGADALA